MKRSYTPEHTAIYDRIRSFSSGRELAMSIVKALALELGLSANIRSNSIEQLQTLHAALLAKHPKTTRRVSDEEFFGRLI